MSIFFFLVIFAIFMYLLMQNNDLPAFRKIYVTIMTVVLIAIAGMRHEAVGSDTYAYLCAFDAVREYGWNELFSNIVTSFLNPVDSQIGKDPGMAILNKLLSLCISSHPIYLSIMASAILIPLGKFFLINCTSLKQLLFAYSFYITLYFSYLPCSAIRQSIAIGILIFGYIALIDNKVAKFLILLFFAALFHKSSLIALLFLFLYLMNRPLLVYQGTLVAFILVLIFYEYLGVILSETNEIYAKYGNSYYSSGQSKPFIIILLYVALYTVGLFTINDYKIFGIDRISGMAMIGTALTTTFIPLLRLDPTLVRITGYFVMWSCVFIPFSISRYSSGIGQFLYFICILLFLYRAFVAPEEYAFFWQDMMLHERYQ